MLELQDVRVDYEHEPVLRGLSLRIGTDEGELPDEAAVTALLGPSGCGKSTLIRAIAGLEDLAGGTIRFDGTDLSDVAPHRRDFGVVFQDGQLFENQTVARNVGYGLRARRWPRSRAAERINELLELVELTALRDRRVTELSGGQAQRVALARALAPRPRLLLLDEPLSALDRQLRDDLAAEIRDILRVTGTPTVLVTHDHTEAATIADRIAVMNDGQIVQTLPPAQLWRRPRTAWVARFLGCTSVIDANVTDGRAQTPLGAVAVSGPDGPAQLGLRPESVIADVAGAPPDATACEVVRAISLPGGRRLRVRTADGALVDAIADGPAEPGDRVGIRLDPEQVAVIG